MKYDPNGTLKLTEHPDAWRFNQMYANIPLGVRGEVCCVIDNEPMSWSVVRIEVLNNTKLGWKALDILKEMKLLGDEEE